MRSALHSNFPTYDGSYPEVVFADFGYRTCRLSALCGAGDLAR